MAKFICKRRPNSLKTCAANLGPLSEIALSGSPYRRYKEFRSIDAVPIVSIILWQGSKITPFEDPWSTTTKIESKPSDKGRSVMKSIVMREKGQRLQDLIGWLQWGVRRVTVDLVLLTGG